MENVKQLRAYSGVTLLEMMVTLSIVGILGAIAVPNLTQMQRSSARTAAVSDFMHSLAFARSRAVMTRGVVSICRSVDGITCNSAAANWETGWIVFDNIDRDQPATRDPNEPIVYRHNGLRTGHITSNRLSFSFRPTGQADVTGTVVFCDPSGRSTEARAVIVSHTGRPRVSRKDASNQPLVCL